MSFYSELEYKVVWDMKYLWWPPAYTYSCVFRFTLIIPTLWNPHNLCLNWGPCLGFDFIRRICLHLWLDSNNKHLYYFTTNFGLISPGVEFNFPIPRHPSLFVLVFQNGILGLKNNPKKIIQILDKFWAQKYWLGYKSIIYGTAVSGTNPNAQHFGND